MLKNFDPPCIIARTPSTRESHHWDIANEAAKGAKANGYASQVVDGAFLYVAIYSDSPLSYPWSQDIDIPSLEKIPTDLVNSSIFFTDPTKNALWFGSTWSHITNEAPSHVYPLFLHPFPIDLLLDMVRGRLFLVIFVNLGKVTEAIQRAGYEQDFRTLQ